MSVTDHDDGGASAPGDRLAPVIPLFGAADGASAVRAAGERLGPGAAATRSGATDVEDTAAPAATWHPTWTTPVRAVPDIDEETVAAADRAEKALLRKLRTRSLSLSEARGVLREHALDADSTERILYGLQELGYLDDAALAEQLVHVAVDRKGQGRQVIAQTLAKRGIARDVADAALATLPDDDLERALAFARTKARSMSGLDPDTAMRRLTGQLARRGYAGTVASSASRTALTEERGRGGVRFD